ncbi:hypothetical protein KKC91_04355 [bacterium]|nr:hypothetical protein [bacterium]MBU1004504.1 hypothetical protein [Nanoarchaeota archaeon]MBU1853686.1 hypothetical protein [Candidatus Omnitrophota bacterium]
MDKSSMLNIVKKLPFDVKETVFKYDKTEVQLFRPSILSKRFKNYDVKKNFQIWLKEGTREFRPNHLRVMIDLNLRVRSRVDLKEKLLLAFDNIFYGKDPVKEVKDLSKEKFEHYLNPLPIIGVLNQLFIVEQEYCYNKESNFDPPTLFYQGWVREFIDNPKEIDNLCMSVCNGQPSLAKYVGKENKKRKSYIEDLKPLWYLQK